ncbi:MAG: hypothetical protein Fur007_11250 [Rhodoferax sp.]
MTESFSSPALPETPQPSAAAAQPDALPPVGVKRAAPDGVAADATAPDQPAAAAPAPAKKARVDVMPVLEQLAQHYPHLFGARFLPLKTGVFHDLMAAHEGLFSRTALRAALGFHTRSSRYLSAVAQGLDRHDLQGQPTGPVATEHVLQAALELYQRRSRRDAADAAAKLRTQLTRVMVQRGLSRSALNLLLPACEAPVLAIVDEAAAQADAQRARQTALARAFASSGQSLPDFARAVGVAEAEVRAAADRAAG